MFSYYADKVEVGRCQIVEVQVYLGINQQVMEMTGGMVVGDDESTGSICILMSFSTEPTHHTTVCVLCS